MFDNLRRAEQARKRKNGGRNGDPAGSHESHEVSAPLVAGEPTAQHQPSRNGTGELPESFVRELGILRNALQSATRDKPQRTILFTSASHGEGVTTLASSFARIVSAGPQGRVLLVEMNARRPTLFWRLGLSAEGGVSHYLSEKRPLATIVQQGPRFPFDVVHVGENDPAKLQMHLEESLPRLLSEASADYDSVIIDAPPVVMSPETPQIARFADGVVMVVRCGRTRREMVRRAINMVEQFDGDILGVVLNRKKYYIPDFIYQRV
jgi:Mrp family chromosome partitioning ATPase